MTKIKNNKVVRSYKGRDWFVIRATNSNKGRVRLGQVMFDGKDIGKKVDFTANITDIKEDEQKELDNNEKEKEKNDE